MSKVSKVETRMWAEINELTERQCLVEVKAASIRHGYYGCYFAKLPSKMRPRQVSDTMYVFDYDETYAGTTSVSQIKLQRKDGERWFALYKLNEERFVACDITDDEKRQSYKKIFTQRNNNNPQVTGFVSALGQLYVSKLDFYNLSGYTVEEWHNDKIKKSGGFYYELNTSENKCVLSLLYEPSNAKYKKIVGASKGEIGFKQGKRATKPFRSSFYLPTTFIATGDVKARQVLANDFSVSEKGKPVITFEPAPRICECCGKPLSLSDGNYISGVVCKSCNETLEKARAIVSSVVSDDVTEHRLEKTCQSLDSVMAMARSIIGQEV